MDWAQILVIILALFLALFLLLGIILIALLIKVTRQIKSVTESASRTVEYVEHAARRISRFTSPLVLGRMVMSIFKKHTRK